MTDEEVAKLMGAAPAPSKAITLSDDDVAKAMEPPKAAEPEQSTMDKFVSAARKGLHTTGTLLTDAADAGTLGYYSKARNAIAGAIAPESTKELQAAEAQTNAEHPFAEGLARGVGYLNPYGAPARLAQAASAGVKMGTQALPAIAARVAGSRPVAGALTGALAGASTGAAEDVAHGADAGDVARNAGRNALIGGVVGGGIGTVSAAASKGREMLRNQKNEMGRTIRGLDEAKAAGAMNTPEFKALQKGAPGFNQAATNAEEQLATYNETLLKDARKQYGQELEDILKDHASRPAPTPKLAPLVSQPASRRAAERAFEGKSFDEVTGAGHSTVGGATVAGKPPAPKAGPAAAERHHLVSDTHDVLNKMEAENLVNGETIDDHLAKAIGKTRRMLTTDTGRISREGERITAPAVKIGDLLKAKKAVANLADYGSPATPETRPYRIIDKTIGREMEAIDPRIAEMNKRYAATMDQLEQSNEILYGSQSPDIYRSVSKQRRARGLLGRVGDETQAATLAEKDIDRLKELDPKYRDIISNVEAKKNFERSRFGFPHVSRRIEHMPLAAIMQNSTALVARVIDPALARMSGQLTPQASLAASPMARALEEKRKRDATMAASLSGGVQQ